MYLDPYASVPTGRTLFDGFDEEDISSIWQIVETSGSTVGITTDGWLSVDVPSPPLSAPAGVVLVPKLGLNQRIDVETVVDNESSYINTYIELKHDSDNYIRVGMRKDGTNNSICFFSGKSNGVSVEYALLITNVDDESHLYSIHVTDDKILISFDSRYVAGLSRPAEFIEYTVGLYSYNTALFNNFYTINSPSIEHAELRSMINDAVYMIETDITDATQTLQGDIADATQTLQGDIADATQTLQDDIADVTQTLHGDIADVTQTLHGDITDAAQTLQGDIADATQTLQDDISYATQTLHGDITAATQTLHGDITAATQTLHGDITDATQTLQGDITDTLPQLSRFSGTLSFSTSEKQRTLEFLSSTYGDLFEVYVSFDLGVPATNPCYVRVYDASAGTYENYDSYADGHELGKIKLVPSAGAEVNDVVYIGVSSTYVKSGLPLRIWIDMYGGVANSAIVYAWEYYSGGSWVSIPGITDNTRVGSYSFGKTGVVVSPLPPSQITVNGTTAYWIRARITTAASLVPKASSVTSNNQNRDDFENAAGEGNVLHVSLYRKVGGSYTPQPFDVMPYVAGPGGGTNVTADVSRLVCYSDTRIMLSLTSAPLRTFTVPYAGIVLSRPAR